MCGYVALLGAGSTKRLAIKGVKVLRHRGPDAKGAWAYDLAALAHVRLSILDLDERSNQPFIRDELVLVYNGELWNFKHIRTILEEEYEVKFETTGDTEVLLRWLQHTGMDRLDQLEGMFSFVLVDPYENKAWIGRDRFGEIPLYFAQTPGGQLAFASELKGLQAIGATAFGQLRPATVTEVDLTTLETEVQRYYTSQIECLDDLTREEAAPKVRKLLEDGVRSRMIADVPICTTLSGGIDSSVITAILAQYVPDLTAFTVVCDPKASDLRAARAVADHLGINLVEVEVDTSDEAVRRTIEAIESRDKVQVEIGIACIPLAEAMAERGFKVAYSGEASDELWGSYGFACRRAATTTEDHRLIRADLVWKLWRRNFPRSNKAFMAAGVECRLPFIHRQLVEYTLRLPQDVVRLKSKLKAVLSTACEDLLPEKLAWRTKVAFQDGTGIKIALAKRIDSPKAEYTAIYKSMYGQPMKVPKKQGEFSIVEKESSMLNLRGKGKKPESKGKEKKESHNSGFSKKLCSTCFLCSGEQKTCIRVPKRHLPEINEDYFGMRWTADAADCAVHLVIDQSNKCSFGCLYCFSNNLSRKANTLDKAAPLRMLKHERLRRIIVGDVPDGDTNSAKLLQQMHSWLDRKMLTQWGGLGDPFDDIEYFTGWGLKAIPMFAEHGIPIRVSTKGARALLSDRYLSVLKDCDNFWFAFSMVTADDKLSKLVDVNVPNGTQRFKAMKALTDQGHPVSIRWRPYIPGISDVCDGKRGAKGEAEFLNRARDAGVKAISYEWIFLDRGSEDFMKHNIRELQRLSRGVFSYEEYFKNSYSREKCLRLTRTLKEEVFARVRDMCHERGIRFGCSDPHFKEWNDTTCCCGIDKGDGIFGNYDEANLTSQMIIAKRKYEKSDGDPVFIRFEDTVPSWASHVRLDAMAMLGDAEKYRNVMWSHKLRSLWNSPKESRNCFQYFQGIFIPDHVDPETKNIVYRYEPDWRSLERSERVVKN